ncbi:MAG: BatD family protein [Candidatus Omnitrophica bacterium]|nr:BatD family protein [Candidatus Omnitrophota bacterium]
MRRRISLILFLILGAPCFAQVSPVDAKLDKETAWTGEAIPLSITLRSPGPFSGSANFDFPKLPMTAFMTQGSPTVGSETVGDDTVMTQLYDITLYTQAEGEVVIPPFKVRFSGKKDFTSPVEDMEGMTPELRFQSKRPPGTEGMAMVVVATDMEVDQTWSQTSGASLEAGDVVSRTISRKASGTTAMMFAPVESATIEGVRIYTGDPTVQDKSERGDQTAERTETLKYLFQNPGTYELPEVTISWWNPDKQEIDNKTLVGSTFSVKPAPVASIASTEESRKGIGILIGLIAVGVVALWFARGWVAKEIHRLTEKQRDPETVAAKRLKAACREGDATKAYQEYLKWKLVGLAGLSREQIANLEQTSAWKDLERADLELSRRLYRSETSATTWNGAVFEKAFEGTRRELKLLMRARESCAPLPPLNPTVK